MTQQIDLDDLPPRIARLLEALGEGETLILTRSGTVVARLTAGCEAPAGGDAPGDAPLDERMAEVMDHFRSMIDEEF